MSKRCLQRSAVGCRPSARRQSVCRAFTLVEMLVAMAITLVMMAAVVTLFANVSNSVRNRRATAEMSGQLRHVRNVLQQDLAGATCPGLTWQRPESNHGYIELIEGQLNDQNPTALLRDADNDGLYDGKNDVRLLDPALSPIPRNNILADANKDGKITAQELEAYYKDPLSLKLSGLGDHDDILMLTTRNEQQPFVGRAPTNVRPNGDNIAAPFNVNDTENAWGYESIESPLAEVVWFSVENPPSDQNPNRFFGEPGMRTVYRRTLLIAPWLNPYRFVENDGDVIDTFQHDGGQFKAEPGLLRMLPDDVEYTSIAEAIAALVAFQDRYDISARLEWDHNIDAGKGRWKIMANTLADLTKRENRFGHFGHFPDAARSFPYPLVSTGNGYNGNKADVVFITDPEVKNARATQAEAEAAVANSGEITSYRMTQPGDGYIVRPFAYIDDEPTIFPATANAVLNDDGQIVRVTFGPAPLWGSRRGQDVMMTDVLAFDLRVYDPGAPLYREPVTQTVLQPSDPGWRKLYNDDMNNTVAYIGDNFANFAGQGAYVDMGYAYAVNPTSLFPKVSSATSVTTPWFAEPHGLSDVFGNLLANGYSVYDTWSFHYENNGVNEDADEINGITGDWQLLDSDAPGSENDKPQIDEGTNGFDDYGHYPNPAAPPPTTPLVILGPDDVGERETAPPYDKPLRGMQVLIRTYEPDSRAIRQVRVNQHFMPE